MEELTSWPVLGVLAVVGVLVGWKLIRFKRKVSGVKAAITDAGKATVGPAIVEILKKVLSLPRPAWLVRLIGGAEAAQALTAAREKKREPDASSAETSD